MPAALPTTSSAWLLDATASVFVALGLGAEAADAVADGLVEADLRGVSSHGVLLVPMYADRMRAGSVSTRERAETVTDVGAVAVLDADHALGVLTGDQAMRLATEKASRFGIGAVVVRRAFHFGGAFRFARQAAREGMIGIAAANTRPLMPAPGGAQAVVGNNPLAIAVPRQAAEPVVLDMALSEAALGKIRLAAAEGRPIPSTWAADAQGAPTTDAEAAIAGLLLPAAGPKGYGLAFMIDVLTGVLSGGSFGDAVKGLYADPATHNDCAHLFIAMAPQLFDDADLAKGVSALAEQVAASTTAPGVDRVLLPGQLEQERRDASLESGVAVSAEVLDALRRTAEQVGATLPPEPGSTA